MSNRPAILCERSTWIVLDKPVGWHTVESGRTDGAPSVERWLREQRPDVAALEECGLVHRLDRDTSGCLMVARSAVEQGRWRDAFAGRSNEVAVRKIYLALIEPSAETEGQWTLAFASRHRGSAKATVSRRRDAGQLGSCRWRCRRTARPDALARAPHAFDLVEIELLGPGRRHQIRAGFAFLGRPLAGDALYGGTPLEEPGAVAERVHSTGTAFCLHALRLEIGDTSVESPPPAWAR
ncbi:MAG: RNA pseudouridine synthase [Phycisphaerales bacterium]|nr:RNA pseudouridine synthase [Phycisphaerales bacterium]